MQINFLKNTEEGKKDPKKNNISAPEPKKASASLKTETDFLPKNQSIDSASSIISEQKKEESSVLKKEAPKQKKITTIKNPEFLKSNLLKTEKEAGVNWSRNVAFLAISFVLAFLLLGSIYWYLSLWGEKKSQEAMIATEEIKKISEEVKAMKDQANKALELKNKIELVNTMLDQHIHWSNFFNFLEDNTLQNVYYSGNFRGNVSGQYVLSANTKSYDLIEAQVGQLLSTPYVLAAGTKKGELIIDRRTEESFVKFDLNLTIDPVIFIK